MKKNKKVTRQTKTTAITICRKDKLEVKKKKSKVILTPAAVFPPPSKLPRHRRTKNKSRMYFDQTTEDAIVLYNNTEDLAIREKLFRERILQPFQKLVENVFNTFKFSYFETGPLDVQKECLTHLVANMHKFDPTRTSRNDPTKKTRAFAYFSIIAKHYLILLNNTNYKKFNQNVEISDEWNENTIQLQQDDKYYAKQELTDFIKLVIDFWEKNVGKIFNKQRDLNIANAIIHIIRNGGNIVMFNKKALYLYIREIAGCRTQQITKVINKLKPIHNKMRQLYASNGIVEIPNE